MNKIRSIIISAGFALTTSLAPVLVSGTAFALFEGAKEQACAGANLDNTGCVTGQGESQITNAVKTAVNLLSFLVAIIAVIMLIIGGLKYITSSGDSSSTTSARNTIIYAVVGIAVASLAQFIVKFVLGRVSN